MIEAASPASRIRDRPLHVAPPGGSDRAHRHRGKPVTKEQFADAFNRVHEVGLRMDTHPTYFETVTAMAFLLFRDAGIRLGVIEVGLGGRLDATNVLSPALSRDHPCRFRSRGVSRQQPGADRGRKGGNPETGSGRSDRSAEVSRPRV